MYNITMISTKHDEFGLCTINELYKIIEAINPEVIFEEIPPSFFDEYYVTKTRRNLETDTINKYLENHSIRHIPVDSDKVPSDSFFGDSEYMHKRIEGLTDINGFNYRTFIDKNSRYTRMYGFQYFNSSHVIGIQNEIDDAIEKGLQKINNEKLNQTYQIWKEVSDNRENEMLQNIYNHSKENQYNQALFLIGSGHRKSIIEKIENYKAQENNELNWTFYNYLPGR